MTGKCPKCGGDLIANENEISCPMCVKVFWNRDGYSPAKIKISKQRLKELREIEKKNQTSFPFADDLSE